MDDSMPARQQLLQANDSSNLRHSPDALSDSLSLRVTCCGVPAEANIHADGTFAYSPDAKFSDARYTVCCRSSPASRAFEVPNTNIVGASTSGEAGFRVWYCPENGKSGCKARRKLQKTEIMLCESQTSANEAVRLIRKLNCWWGRDNPPKLLILINPVSGSGRSKAVWKNEAHPILQAAGLTVEAIETRKPKHAFEVAKKASVHDLDAIACVAGDGTMSEILQGLFDRPDWAKAVQVPLCLVPGGTGNGMSASVGIWTPVMAAHGLCKGKVREMDVVSILQPPRPPLYAFLSMTFGFIANVDIGTEDLRCLGLLRNQIGAIRELVRAGEYRACVAAVSSHAAVEMRRKAEAQHGERSSSHPPTPLLDSLGAVDSLGPLQCASLPQGWQLMERESYNMLTVSIQPWLALDFTLEPSEAVDSGEMTLTSLPGSMSRFEALQAMLKADAGKIGEARLTQTEKIAAFVIEPSGSGTWLVMDGEVLPFERVFGEIHPGLCNVITAA